MIKCHKLVKKCPENVSLGERKSQHSKKMSQKCKFKR